MTLVITSYGNGALLTKVIMGVSYIMSNSNYLLLIQLVVILAGVVGLIVSHRENVAGGSVGLKLIGTLAVAGVVWSSFYLPQDTVIVYDPVNNYQTSVRNVPVPLALPMYLENSIGDGLASLYDAYMGKSGFPNSLSYNNTGFNWGSIATQQLQNVNFVNPYDQATINSYLVNCYFPAVMLGHASILDLYNSDNILQTLQQGSQTSDAFLAEIYNTGSPGGNGVDCNTAYNYIVGMVNATTSTGSVAQSYAATLDGKTQAHGLTLAQVTNNLGPAADFLLNTGLDSQQLITQMALANSLSPAFQEFSARYGVPDNNLSFGVAQTEYQQQTVWTQTAFMARIFLPILHFIMEAIIFGSFPLIFLMTLIPGFSKKAFGYIMSMLMWLTFWAPLMSILNGLSAWLISTNAFPLNVTGGNVNLNDMGYIYSNLREWSAMIGSASMTVPMLAYGLATMSSFVGAETVAGVTGAISGGINTAAQTVATEKGAQGLQNQAQNMMQNQANNAYTDPSQFDGIMENNAESVAAQRQAMSDFIHRRGMGNVESAGLAGMEYQYGVNSTLGAKAEHIGGLAAKNQMGTLQGLDNYAKSQGLNMEQIAAINSEYGGFSTLNKAKGTEAGLGGPLTSGKVNAEQTGIDSFNSAKVNDMLKLYQQEGMSSTEAASQIAYTNGIAVAIKNGKETEIFGSNGKVAMIMGSTVQNGFSESWVKDGNGKTIWTSRSAGMDTTNGYFTKQGNYVETYDGQKYVFGPKVDGSTQNINDYARRYMEANNALAGSLAGYSSPQRAIQALDEAKTLAKEGQFKAAGAILKTFNMTPNQYKIDGAYSLPSVENAANSRIDAIQREEQNARNAGNGMIAASIAYHNEALATGAPTPNANQSFYETTAKPLQEFYNTQLSTSVKNGVASSKGSKSSTTGKKTFQQSYELGVDFGKIIDPDGGLTLGASGGYTHATIYSSEQYSDFKKDWSNATTVEARTNVLMKTYSEGLSNIDNMNISGTEKAELKAKLLQGFYGAA